MTDEDLEPSAAEKEVQEVLKPQYSLVRYLSKYNATRRCVVCGEDAAFYIYTGGETSDFRCLDHARELAEAVRGTGVNGERSNGRGVDGR